MGYLWYRVDFLLQASPATTGRYRARNWVILTPACFVRYALTARQACRLSITLFSDEQDAHSTNESPWRSEGHVYTTCII